MAKLNSNNSKSYDFKSGNSQSKSKRIRTTKRKSNLKTIIDLAIATNHVRTNHP